jgi:hypothetical protein
MTETAATLFIVSLSVWIVLLVVVSLEQRQGKRFFMKRFRRWLDVVFLQVGQKVKDAWSNFIRYVLQLGWYYSIHSLLRTSLKVLHRMYEYVENHFENNRKKAKVLRAEKRNKFSDSHLGQVAEHKAKVALTEAEGTELRNQKLEDTH